MQALVCQSPIRQLYRRCVNILDPHILVGLVAASDTERTEAQVTRGIDGDTIEVDIAGQSFRLRYIGMDTPEDTSQVEYFGPQATAFNAQLVEGKQVTLIKDVSETDRFNRLLRYVIVDGFFVNYELVRQGFATSATFPPDVACQEVFREAERQGREEEKGLWAVTPTPVPSNTLPPPPPTSTTNAPPPPACHPSYPDVCLDPNAVDYDCAGGSGNGPLYVQGPIRVLPPDPFDLDRDGDGIGCE